MKQVFVTLLLLAGIVTYSQTMEKTYYLYLKKEDSMKKKQYQKADSLKQKYPKKNTIKKINKK